MTGEIRLPFALKAQLRYVWMNPISMSSRTFSNFDPNGLTDGHGKR